MKPTLFYDSELLSVSMTGSDAQLTIKYQEQEIVLQGESSNAIYCRKLLEKQESNTPLIGLTRLIQRKSSGSSRNRNGYRFDPYVDQTLRRAFDLDVYEFSRETHNTNSIGWRNAKYPGGFLAPKGLVPGQQGRFISSSTQDIPVAVPLEFFELCIRMRSDPEAVLKSFIADVCHLSSTPELPRADANMNRGTEAKRKARDYLRQAWHLKKDFFS
ncbi:MAG: hypothetical protein ACI4NO_03095 [Oxalobacter sp.]